MSRRASKKKERSHVPEAAPADRGASAAAVLLTLAIAAAALLVDPGAEAAFDAPKRLAALVLTAAAAAAAFLGPPRGKPFAAIWRSTGRLPRAAFFLAAAALAGAVVSALSSPRRAMSLDAARGIAILALLLPLGASRVLARRGSLLLAVFLTLAALDAAVSILQGRGIWRPFALDAASSRENTGAFVGNVGYLATALAIGAVAAIWVAIRTPSRPLRFASFAAALLFLADLVINQNLTSLLALAAGCAALFWAWRGRRAILPVAAVAAAVALALLAYKPARVRAGEAAAALRAGDLDRLLTYRLGPWSAALEMARERPVVGYGPGTFAAEFVSHRLKAEMRARRRLVNPLATSSYGEAHSEPLQALAEGGAAGLAAVAAAACLLGALWRAARSGDRRSAEAALLLAILSAGAVASLTWFPLQRPVSSIPLLLAAGRGWRIAADASDSEEGEGP